MAFGAQQMLMLAFVLIQEKREDKNATLESCVDDFLAKARTFLENVLDSQELTKKEHRDANETMRILKHQEKLWNQIKGS